MEIAGFISYPSTTAMGLRPNLIISHLVVGYFLFKKKRSAKRK